MAPDPRLELLDGAAKELAREAGFDAGERLLEHFGRQRVCVPHKMRPRSRFWETLGPNAAKVLSRLFGGDYITVPTGSKAQRRLSARKMRRQVAAYLAAQRDPKMMTKDHVAATFRCNRRTVQRVRVAIGPPTEHSDQSGLFEKRLKPV